MKRSSIRLCAPALLSTFLASSALTAATITDGLERLGFAPQNAYAFGQDENGNLQFTLRDETVLQKLAGVEMPTTDASDDDPRFFKADDDGRYTAIVTHHDVAQMLAGKKLSQSRWSNIITDLVDAAKISSLPPAMHAGTGARPAAA